MRYAAAVVSAWLALQSAACTSHAVVITDRPLTDRDLAMAWSRPANRDSGDFSEQLKIVGTLPDGGTIYVRLSVTNVAKYDGHAELLGKIELADGRSFRVKTTRERDGWEFGADRFYAKVGDSTVTVTLGRAEVHLAGDDFTLDMTLTSDLPALRPAGGTFDRGGAFYVTTLPIPRGTVEATLTVQALAVKRDAGGDDDAPSGDEAPATPESAPEAPPSGEATTTEPGEVAPAPPPPAAPSEGEAAATEASEASEASDEEGVDRALTVEEEVHDLEGVGYVEHRATNLTPYRMAKRWFKVADVQADRTVAMSAFERTDELGGGIQGWLLVVDGDEVQVYENDVLVGPQQIQRDDDNGYDIPQLLYFGPRDGSADFQGVLRVNELAERQDDLSSLSRLERVVVRRLMKPWTYRYDASDYLFKRRLSETGEAAFRGQLKYEYQVLN